MALRNLVIAVALTIAWATPASAQLVVIDPANLTQTIQIAERTLEHYNQLRMQYELILLMARRLGSMDAYRIPSIEMTRHDPGRWTYGRPWIEALNSGDAQGTAYLQSVVPLQVPSVVPERLTSSARLALERAYATIEIADSIAQLGAHQVALSRGYH